MQKLIDFVVRLLTGFVTEPVLPRPTPPTVTFPNTSLVVRIIAAMNKHGYVIDRNPGEVNIVYLEGCDAQGVANQNRPNAFDDRRIVFVFENGQPSIVGNWAATTQTGVHYTEHPLNPDGAAIIELGQQRCWTVGLHQGKYEALVQRGAAVVVGRDANRDYRRDGDKRTTGFFGINQHHGYDAPIDNIGPHSAGCLVTPRIADHLTFMRQVKSDPRYVLNKSFVFRTAVMPVEWL